MKPIYNSKGWVLCRCGVCNRKNYVEPHGTTADCKKCKRSTEHVSIPFAQRDASGTAYLGGSK